MWFLHNCDIFDRNCASPPELPGNITQCCFTVKHHMGRIAAVMPRCEMIIVSLETGHKRQPSTRTKQSIKASEFFGWPMEMFDGLSAGDEIIQIIERFSIGVKKRIE